MWSATGHQRSCSMTSSPSRGASGAPPVALAEQRGQLPRDRGGAAELEQAAQPWWHVGPDGRQEIRDLADDHELGLTVDRWHRHGLPSSASCVHALRSPRREAHRSRGPPWRDAHRVDRLERPVIVAVGGAIAGLDEPDATDIGTAVAATRDGGEGDDVVAGDAGRSAGSDRPRSSRARGARGRRRAARG